MALTGEPRHLVVRSVAMEWSSQWRRFHGCCGRRSYSAGPCSPIFSLHQRRSLLAALHQLGGPVQQCPVREEIYSRFQLVCLGGLSADLVHQWSCPLGPLHVPAVSPLCMDYLTLKTSVHLLQTGKPVWPARI